VYTNHFALRLDPDMPLHKYDIKGLTERTSKRISRILVQETIDALPFLHTNPANFATDYKEKLIVRGDLDGNNRTHHEVRVRVLDSGEPILLCLAWVREV
jgi:hypothetical protein